MTRLGDFVVRRDMDSYSFAALKLAAGLATYAYTLTLMVT